MASEEKRPLLTSVPESRGVIEGVQGSGDFHYNSFPNHTPLPEYGDARLNGNPGTETQKLTNDGRLTSEIKVYKRRWYIVVVYSLFASFQNFIWNAWGPISSSAEAVFGWNDATIAWMNNWGPVAYIVSGLFFPWLLQVKGMRVAVVSSMVFISIGVTLRVITSESEKATILIHMGQFLNGLGGPMAMGAIPQLSSTWFPPNERVTASAIGFCISTFGAALSFIVGPLVVSDHASVNSTSNKSMSFSSLDFTAQKNESDIDIERKEIMNYMYYTCGIGWAICLALFAYFPSKPPSPPGLSASAERESYWAGMWSLRRKGPFLVVAFTYGISLGVMNCWNSVIAVNLKPFGISETEAGWIGFYSYLGGCAFSLLIGRFADYFTRFMKLFIVILYLLATGTLVVFALMLIKLIPFSDALLYVTVITATTCLNAAVPLLFELSCELAYPTSEGAANGVLTYLNNLAGLIFLAVFSFPHLGKMWMNWTVIGSTVVCIPLIGFLRGRFKRLEVDEQLHPEEWIADQEIAVDYQGTNSVNR